MRFHGSVQKLMDGDESLGRKLEVLRAWRLGIEEAERYLTIQMGVDVAKDLMARGVQPTGRTVGEAYESLEATDGD